MIEKVSAMRVYVQTAISLLCLSILAGCASSARQTVYDRAIWSPENEIPTLQAISDPIEPMNRAFSGFNQGLYHAVIHPLNQGYTFIVPKPVRTSIDKFSSNLAYPVRGLNNLLQGKFSNSLEETERFFVNLTVGFLGFFDPATGWGLEKHPEDFGQTLAHYGGNQGFYLVLPFVGPSTGLDAIGRIVDYPLNLANYLAGASSFVTFNQLSSHNRDIKTLIASEADLYSMVRNGFAVYRAMSVADYQVEEIAGDPEPSLGSLMLKPKDPKFVGKGNTRKVRMPWTGEKLPYDLWLQEGSSEILLILPGLGSHRTSHMATGLAELAYDSGYSVVIISSAMHTEFMTGAATVATPGHPYADCQAIVKVLDEIRSDLREKYPSRFTGASVLGYSLGGYHALTLAAMDIRNQTAGIHFDRYLAINPPKSFLNGLRALDELYDAPLQISSQERGAWMRDTLFKAMALGSGQLKPTGPLPLSRLESEFLIGLAFKLSLRDVIFASQQKSNIGVLREPLSSWRRQPVYDEIRQFGYKQYLEEIGVPYLLNVHWPRSTRDQVLRALDLESIETELRTNDRVRVHLNTDDFLLAPGDIDWFKAALGDRVRVFDSGGHLGNLYLPEIQNSILKSLKTYRRE
ncbi:MlaA family lipoprotein [Candidatus Sumerlaeota bacterium]